MKIKPNIAKKRPKAKELAIKIETEKDTQLETLETQKHPPTFRTPSMSFSNGTMDYANFMRVHRSKGKEEVKKKSSKKIFENTLSDDWDVDSNVF